MRLQPLFDRILVAPIDDESPVTSGGLLVPDIARGKRQYGFGEVMAIGVGRIGPDGTLIPISLKVGDVVAFPRSAGIPFPMPSDTAKDVVVLILREPECLCTVLELPRDTGLTGADGRPLLAMQPQSTALPDSVYKNVDDWARARHDLRDAPPDVLAELDDEGPA
jgi:co-chaperonin GroES (HSP10)